MMHVFDTLMLLCKAFPRSLSSVNMHAVHQVDIGLNCILHPRFKFKSKERFVGGNCIPRVQHIILYNQVAFDYIQFIILYLNRNIEHRSNNGN